MTAASTFGSPWKGLASALPPSHAWALAGGAFLSAISALMPPQSNLEVPFFSSCLHNGIIPSLGHHVRLCKQPACQAPRSSSDKLPTPALPRIFFTCPEPPEMPPGPGLAKATPPQNRSLRSLSALECEGCVHFNCRRRSFVSS